jgi:hypothetical protein
VTLLNSHQVPVVFLCCRGLFELAAHSYYVKEKLKKPIEKANWDACWELLLKVKYGSRYRHKRGATAGEPAYPNGVHIYDALGEFNAYFPDGAKLKTAEEHHEHLSEFCHPNSDAFTNHFDWAEELNTAVVKFVKPDPEFMMLALPDAALACFAFLDCAGDLLYMTGEAAMRDAFVEFRERSMKHRGGHSPSSPT